MIDIKTLLPELRELVGDLSEDLIARSSDAGIKPGCEKPFSGLKKGAALPKHLKSGWKTTSIRSQ